MKECRRCHKDKPNREFHLKHDARDKLYPYCRECRRELDGHEPRKPPVLVEVSDDAVEEIQSKIDEQTNSCRWKAKIKEKQQQQDEDVTYEQLVAEALKYADHPALVKKRKVRNTAARLRENPLPSFDSVWSEKDEDMADMLFDAWDKRQKQDVEAYRELNERLPIITRNTKKSYQMKQGLSYDVMAAYDEGNFGENE